MERNDLIEDLKVIRDCFDINTQEHRSVMQMAIDCLRTKEADSSVPFNEVLGGLGGVEVTAIDKYRSDSLVNKDCDRARVVLDLKFPKHLNLYHKLKKMAV